MELRDPEMPYDMALPDLDHAIERAFAAAANAEATHRSDRLSRLAYEKLEDSPPAFSS